MTQTVLKSASVIIGCVGSLSMLPRAIDSAVMLPAIDARTVNTRERSWDSPDTPSTFKWACVRAYSADACR